MRLQSKIFNALKKSPIWLTFSGAVCACDGCEAASGPCIVRLLLLLLLLVSSSFCWTVTRPTLKFIATRWPSLHPLPFHWWYYEVQSSFCLFFCLFACLLTHLLDKDTSQWTLDYPPLFAWFEWLLAQVARLFDPGMLTVQEQPYLTPATLVFQRLSVICADMVLFVGVRRWSVLKCSIPFQGAKL